MNYEQVVYQIYSKLPDFLFAVIIFAIFWIISVILKNMTQKILSIKNNHKNISEVLSKIVKNIVLIIGFISSLGTLGMDVSAIVAGLGLTGFAFGFAFKDMLSNFISGVLIFIYEPFKIGDIIQVEGKEGKVTNINLRYVTIESDNENILIPNSISVSKIVSVNK